MNVLYLFLIPRHLPHFNFLRLKLDRITPQLATSGRICRTVHNENRPRSSTPHGRDLSTDAAIVLSPLVRDEEPSKGVIGAR